MEWGKCSRCSFEYPLQKLVKQNGLIVCTVTCYDEILVEERPMMIANVLNDESELRDESEREIGESGDLRFVW